MSTYSFRNPLLDNAQPDKFKDSHSSLKSFFSYCQFTNIGSKRIVPTFSSKEIRKSFIKPSSPILPNKHRVKQRSEQSEPLVHYNGPLETLDQLPQEKLAWITKETSDDKELRHPLLDYPKSIVFHRSTTAKLSIYAQPKTAFGSLNPRFRQPEVCLGTQEFKISMRPTEKKLKRITLQDKETQHQYQVLVVYGTYVESRVMTLLDNKLIYEGFITVYTRGKFIPRWARYWATLYPGHIELYDFEYKERKKALYKISIKALIDVFHPPTDDDERLVDVGSLGLALQFSHESLDNSESQFDLEYRMYILPDDMDSSQEWEQAFMHAASLINEFRFDSSYLATKVEPNTVFKLNDVQHGRDEIGTMIISSKFLWCCQPTYNSQILLQNGINVIDLPFKDGGVPPPTIVHQWLQVVESKAHKEPTTIAVHCVAGLGRAPVLVAIALIELGMAPLDAIEYIRGKRRGAFNKPQISYLDGYQRKPTTNTYSFRTSLGRMFGFGPKPIVTQQT
ncbi:hypothetical protein INT48_008457 [Thamnidium elegans]|uniref:Protein tyrosine phosphatase n=1 Tax=Thamnidium elegans TaxID=101142 RepID=A0A8H7SST1_9FUNG|nr:hypothetical protein INT48_008457 [Thamnidium elegans]